MGKRLTTARQWCEAKNELENELGYSHILVQAECH